MKLFDCFDFNFFENFKVPQLPSILKFRNLKRLLNKFIFYIFMFVYTSYIEKNSNSFEESLYYLYDGENSHFSRAIDLD